MLPTRGSDWSRAQLDYYNIILQQVSLQTFYGIPSLPDDDDVPDMSYRTASSVAPTYKGNEGTVNMLALRLLDDSMLTVVPSYAGLHPDLTFQMGYDKKTAAKPDLAVYANIKKIMIVLENKREHYITHPMLLDVMAQLVAEAIAAHTFNRCMAPPQAPILVSSSFIHAFFMSLNCVPT